MSQIQVVNSRQPCGCTHISNDGQIEHWETCDNHHIPPLLRDAKPKPRRFYMKHSIVTAEQQPDGRWQVRGPAWLKYAVFDDEDFRKCFEEIL